MPSIRYILHRMPDGNYKRFPVDNVPVNPIRHKDISEEHLKRIREIYDTFRSIKNMVPFIPTASLESFEIYFMRSYDLEEMIVRYETIIKVYSMVLGKFKIDSMNSLYQIFSLIVMIAFDGLNEDEKSREDIQKIIIVYEQEVKKKELKG